MNSNFPYNGILPFTYQASGILFADWINLFTLCLAPLIVHIVAGVPSPVYLSNPRPRWHERLGHYNPTSILWRYFSIIDRRARSRAWNTADMAASNAHFWTSSGWDGSENMMRKSRRFCSRIPSSPHAVWVSKTSAETMATVFQGLQATWQLVGGLNSGGYSNTISLGTVFAPLAIYGLLRLPAAVWISEDYSYVDVDIDGDSDPEMEICDGYNLTSTLNPRKSPTSRTLLSFGLLEPFPVHSLDLHSPRSWRVLLFACMLVLVCVAGLETRATPCGLYTTTPPGFFDMVVCGGLSVARNGVVEGIPSGLPFGVAWRNSSSEEMESGAFYVGDFDGWCKIATKGDVVEVFMPVNLSTFGG